MDKRHANYQPWEKAFDRILTPYEEFIHDETASGLILMVCTLVALFLANGFLHEHYEHLLHTEFALSMSGWKIRHTLHHWINDGLIALFIMVVGLKIKREVVIGAGLVSGIGFTIYIFIAELGFAGQPDNLLMAETGVLFASVLASAAGYLWLRLAAGRN